MILRDDQRIANCPRAPRRSGGTPFPIHLMAPFRNSAVVPYFMLSIWMFTFIVINAAIADTIHWRVLADNRTTSPIYDPQQHRRKQSQRWKQRFLKYLEKRKSLRRMLNRLRNAHLLKSSSLDIPIITDPSLNFHLHPTSALLIASERRKLMSSSYFHFHLAERGADMNSTRRDGDESHYETWFAPEQNAAVYAAIPDVEDPSHIENQPLQDFYLHRHLSRYERLYRTKHDYDLQYNWNGYYDGKFWNQIVLFDDSAATCMNCSHHCNFTSPGSRRPLRSNHRRLEQASSNIVISAGGIFNNYQAVPLSQGYGTHFANVWVGTPTPQRKTVIVDTGSHYTAFPCTGCVKCGAPHHTDPYFRPENSKTFQQLQCNECQDGVVCENGKCKFNQGYTEGSSWEAIQVKDQFYCGGTDVLDSVSPTDQKYAIEFMFGCQVSMTGLFITQLADGIMGMSAHPATLPKKLYDAGKIENNMFAMCYRRELGTSKRGVSAGSMTIGGVSNNLDTSPFVFAKNMAKVGWFTVYVKNIYIRSGGGQSARSLDPTHQTIKVRINANTLNSGKGVIVDSGTTDTYLNKRVAADFTKAWKKATGQAYSHVPMSLTPEQLRSLPTILIQCQAFSHDIDPTIEDYDSIPGYAGSLDPSSPRDLLIAIPATSYMDYSPITQRYMSRLYFTESVGGVLGSNTMQGHNVLFDWQNGRIGFAESSCTYDKKDVPSVAEDNGFASDCKVSDPILSRTCLDTVDRQLCKHNPTGIALYGNETWTAVVENAGNDAGTPCFEPPINSEKFKDTFEPVISCSGKGICEEFRPCLLTCAQAAKDAEIQRLSVMWSSEKKRSRCGDSGWSACDYGCMQTKIISEQYSDGICHEESRETRPCHIGACSREDPCRIPFIVHVVLAFRDGAVSKWSKEAEEVLATSLSNAVNSGTDGEVFSPGDVFVAAALPWYQDQDSNEFEDNKIGSIGDYGDSYNSVILGVKVVVEISIYNALADFENKPFVSNEFSDENDGAIVNMLRNITDMMRGKKPHTACSSDELYPLAKLALKAKNVLQSEDFMISLIDEIRITGEQADRVPFGPITYLTYKASENRVLSVWTIRTGIHEEINYFGPQKALSAKLFSFIRNLFVLSSLVLVMMVLWNGVASLYAYFVFRQRQKGNQKQKKFTVNPRHLPYSVVTRISGSDDPYDIEDSIIMGLGGDIDLPGKKSTFKSNMVTKRFRRLSPIDKQTSNGF